MIAAPRGQQCKPSTAITRLEAKQCKPSTPRGSKMHRAWMEMSDGWVYTLKLERGNFYVGSTRNLEYRIAQHSWVGARIGRGCSNRSKSSQ